MPDLGETRTANGETRTWDGTAWRIAKASAPAAAPSTGPQPETYAGGFAKGLKDYGSELLTGKGPARGEVTDFGTKEAQGFGSALNPINQAKGVLRLVTTDPRETVRGMVDTGSSALGGDPRAIGSILGMVVAPKADALMLRGVNSGATAVAEKPYVQHTLGAVGGALAAKGVGLSPFIGMGVGRAASGLLKGPAEDVAAGSGWLMNKLGMSESTPTAPAATNGLTVAEKAQLVKEGYPPELIQKLDQSAQGWSSGKPPDAMTSDARAVKAAAPEQLKSLREIIMDRLRGGP